MHRTEAQRDDTSGEEINKPLRPAAHVWKTGRCGAPPGKAASAYRDRLQPVGCSRPVSGLWLIPVPVIATAEIFRPQQIKSFGFNVVHKRANAIRLSLIHGSDVAGKLVRRSSAYAASK